MIFFKKTIAYSEFFGLLCTDFLFIIRMKHWKLTFFFGFLALTAIVEAQSVSLLDSAVINFVKYIKQFPQEKIYLQTDKPYYISGEKIWFRAHLVDAHGHCPVQADQYVYTELISPLDSVMIRLKVRWENGIFQGHITLPDDLPEGNYKIRAYTNYMRNAGEDYYFTKYVFVGAPQSAFIQTVSEFNFEGNRRVSAVIRFIESKQNELYIPEQLTIQINKERERIIRPNKDGAFQIDLNLPLNSRHRIIYAAFEYERRLYEQYISIPFPDDVFDVSFFPEGGYIIPDVGGKIAFKALQPNGAHVNITGVVFDNDDYPVADLITSHLGMGLCMFVPVEGKTYYAVCENEKGYSKRFDLPLPQKKASIIEANWVREQLYVSVKKNTAADNDTLYLLAHVRGRICYVGEWDWNKEYLSMNKKDLPSGVMHILLLNSSLKPVSERLVFIDNTEEEIVLSDLTTDKPAYEKRELIRTTFQATEKGNIPLQASCAISVTDDGEVTQDTTRNILTTLLLHSDLKGYIENPAHYFQTNNKKAQLNLDILMMTQGWRRYDIETLLQKPVSPPAYPLEVGPEISGTVKGFLLAKPYADATVSIVSSAQHFDVTQTDQNGRFYFRNIELPYNTRILVQALSKKGSDQIELVLDRETFPPITAPHLNGLPTENKDVFRDYLYKADKHYTFENGMRMIHLAPVVVRAEKKPQFSSPYYSTPNTSFNIEEIEESAAGDILQFLSFMAIPGVDVNGNSVSIRGAQGNPLLVVDEIIMDFDYLEILNISDVAQIDVIKDATAAAFGSRGGNGVISIYTRRGGEGIKERPQYNVARVTPLGYHVPAEFYSPKYETRETRENPTPDFRTTLYWNPNISTDENGEASFEFYSADSDSDYSIRIEGISDEGRIIHYTGKIKRSLQ